MDNPAVVKRVFDFSIETLWKAWADPGQRSKWYDHETFEIKETVSPTKLVFTWPIEGKETTVMLTFRNIDQGKTEVTLTHERLGKASEEHRKGWESTFNNLEKYLKS